MEETSFLTSKDSKQQKKIAQSKCRILHALYKLIQADSVVTFRTYNPELNLSCHELLVVFGLSTLNSNHTYHKLRITN